MIMDAIHHISCFHLPTLSCAILSTCLLWLAGGYPLLESHFDSNAQGRVTLMSLVYLLADATPPGEVQAQWQLLILHTLSSA